MVRKKKGIQRYKPDTSKTGPKSLFPPGMLRKVTLLAKLGATNKTFAEFFEKDISTIENWIKNAPEFKKAKNKGGIVADMKVIASFFQRAIGYDYTEQQIVQCKGVPVAIDVKKHVISDVKACQMWLANRQRELWAVNTIKDIRVQGNINHNHHDVKDIPDIKTLSKQARKIVFEISQKQLALSGTSDN